MKKYTQPSIELTKFDVEDVIMASGTGSTSLKEGTDSNVLNSAKGNLTGGTAGYTVVVW